MTPARGPEARIRDLVLLGLAEPEARAYAYLTEHGARTARQVSAATGIGRSRTYTVLENLEGRGLLEVLLDEPRRFAALPLDDFIEDAIDDADREVREAERLRASLARLFHGPRTSVEGVTGALRLAEGRRKASATLARALGDAERHICWLTTPAGVLRLANHQEGWDALGGLTRRAVDARVLLVATPGTPAAEIARAAALLPGAVRVVTDAPAGLAGRALVDSARLLLLSASPDDELAYRGDDLLLDTTVPALVADAAGLFDRLWARSAPTPARSAA